MSTIPRSGTLAVYTARVGFSDPDALDVTRKSGDALGRNFAPSWSLLAPYLEKRHRGELTDRDWQTYAAAFLGQMDASREHCPGAWRALLARRRVVLLCYCADPERCHRTLLARDILPRFGAVYHGELPTSRAQCDLFGGR
jgi:uncharacterized protein YeaO (DUF488 family)